MIKKRYIQTETTRHGKTIYYFRRAGSPRYRLPDEYGSSAFWREYQNALEGRIPDDRHKAKNVKGYRRIVALHECIRQGVFRAKGRAKARGIEFDISTEWAIEQMKESDYRCPLTGIPFDVKESVQSFARPHAPSLDRKDPRKGYTKDNVRIVVYAINMMISDWGEEIFSKAAYGYRQMRRKKRTSIPEPEVNTP